jgi:hypothetical protein
MIPAGWAQIIGTMISVAAKIESARRGKRFICFCVYVKKVSNNLISIQ